MPDDNHKRDIALKMLADGDCTQGEAATLAGVSRQLVRYWLNGSDPKPARRARLRAIWRKLMHAPRA